MYKHECPKCGRLNYKKGVVNVLAALDSVPVTSGDIVVSFTDYTSYWANIASAEASQKLPDDVTLQLQPPLDISKHK